MRALVLAGALLLAAGPAAAHRGHAVLSVVEVDAATRVATITHRMSAHDVEPALTAIAPDAQPSLDDPEAVAALQAYVARRFAIGDETGPARPELVRFEAAGDEVTMTYRAGLSARAETVVIDSDLFEAVHADTENQVNVRVGGVTRTLLFLPGEGAQTLEIRPAR